MATITKRGKSYRIRTYAGYDLEGRQIERTKTWTPPSGWSEKRAYKEAQRQAVIFEEQVRCGQVVNGKIKFADFAQLWFERYADQQLRPRTVARYRELLVKINLFIGHIPLEKVQPSQILDFYRSLKDSEPISATYLCIIDLKKFLKDRGISQACFSKMIDVSLTTLSTAWHRKPVLRRSAEKISIGLDMPLETCFRPSNPKDSLSPSTIHHYHSLVSKILADAVNWQYIPYNPCARITPPKAESPDIAYLDDKQAQHLVELLRKEPGYYRRAALLLLLTGMRRGELLGLEWQDIDWKNKTMYIVRTSQYLPPKGVFTDSTKNKASKRIIYIADQVLDVLRDQLLWQQNQANTLGDAWGGSPRVITSPEGLPMHPDRLSRWFSKFIKRTDLPPIHLHSLRHTYATLCIAKGVPITAVAAQLGHANVATTTTIYAHAIKSAQLAAADKVGGLFADIL